jgi:hypothetical protein
MVASIARIQSPPICKFENVFPAYFDIEIS